MLCSASITPSCCTGGVTVALVPVTKKRPSPELYQTSSPPPTFFVTSLLAPVNAFTAMGKPQADTRRCWNGASAIPAVLALAVPVRATQSSGIDFAFLPRGSMGSAIMVLGSILAISGLPAGTPHGLPAGTPPGTVSQNLRSSGSHRGCSNPVAPVKET